MVYISVGIQECEIAVIGQYLYAQAGLRRSRGWPDKGAFKAEAQEKAAQTNAQDDFQDV